MKPRSDSKFSLFGFRLPFDRGRLVLYIFFVLCPLFLYWEAIDYGLQALRFPDKPQRVTAEEAVTRLDDRARLWVEITDATVDCRKPVSLPDRYGTRTYYLVNAPLQHATIIAGFGGGPPCNHAFNTPLAGKLYRYTRLQFYINGLYSYDFMAAADPGNTWALCAYCTRSNAVAVTVILLVIGSLGPGLLLAPWISKRRRKKRRKLKEKAQAC